MKKFILLAMIVVGFTSCAELLQLANAGMPITEEENANGLKSSLNVGIENAVKILGAENGFMNDAVAKVLLPKEAMPIINNIKLIPGGEKLVNDAILSLNRAAEDAVKDAVPIFKQAILSMSFSDVTGVLFGGKNAATQYLQDKTSQQLVQAFAPKVRNSLAKPLLANVSTNESWGLLTSNYNKVAATPMGAIAGLQAIDVDLESYVTQQAINALFLKIADEEQNIRENPMARVTPILKRVFGQLDNRM